MCGVRRFSFLSALILAFFLLSPSRVFPAGRISLFLTSNLLGRFDPNTNSMTDPMLKAGLSLLKEKKTDPDLVYFDLGNAFYPGLLSRYSYGALTYDFLNFFDCTASLISSLDCRIGVDNLALLQENLPGRLLSANIRENGKTVFNPYVIKTNNGEPVAFIGLSSSDVLFDIAERTALKLDFIPAQKAFSNAFSTLKQNGIVRIILLTGMPAAAVLKLMTDYPQISGAICGGDNPGSVGDIAAERIILADGRFVMMMPRRNGYYLATLDWDNRGITLRAVTNKRWTSQSNSSDTHFRDFQKRLKLWKHNFSMENNVLIDLGKQKCPLSDSQAAKLLRDVFKSEIAMVKLNSITSCTLSGMVSGNPIFDAVKDEYSIYVFQLLGAELQTVLNSVPGIVMGGYDGHNVQGVPEVDDRNYRIICSQAVYESIQSVLERRVPYKNLWRNLPEIILDDLKTKRILSRNNFDYLDARYRWFVQGQLSVPLNWTSLQIDPKVQIPAGAPTTAFRQWGINGSGSVSLYNKYNSLALSVTVNLLDETIFYPTGPEAVQLLNNSLDASFVYTRNLSALIQPYYKSTVDTVVLPAPAPYIYPVVLRNTVGGSWTPKYFSGQVGLGIEQNVNDPLTPPVIGLELIPSYTRNILPKLGYTFSGDVFISALKSRSIYVQVKNDINNTFQIPLTQSISFSIAHRWLFFYSGDTKGVYSMQQLNVAINLNSSLKFF